jgi:TIR domain
VEQIETVKSNSTAIPRKDLDSQKAALPRDGIWLQAVVVRLGSKVPSSRRDMGLVDYIIEQIQSGGPSQRQHRFVTLSPSERITTIREISNRLNPEEWAMLDLTLKQFGLKTTDEWRGDKTSYILEMVSPAPDTVLVELAKHLGFETDNGPHNINDAAFWIRNRLRVFVSHLAIHKSIAGELQQFLYPLGISCFVAHNDIEPTLEWQNQIELALATCDLLVALLHPEFHKSNWTDQEIGFVMGRGIPIFAVRLGQDPYGFIGRFQAFNGQGKNIAGLAKEIFDACRKHKQCQPKMADALVSLFEESGSFADAKNRIGYLEELPVWEKSYRDRVILAAKANGQIAGSWGVPERVERLIKKWS